MTETQPPNSNPEPKTRNQKPETRNPLFAGVDVGASRTKVALLDQHKRLVGHEIRKSGVDFAQTAQACLDSALKMAGALEAEIRHAVSTGYGRKNVQYSRGTKTEIACHAKGCFHYFPVAMTIIDIGGQDNKIIKVDERGRRTSFKMNRKCAAGTGAFLEEMAMRLDIPIEEMDGLARQSEHMVELGSYCTVFSGTEVLEKIRQGKQVADIVKGLFFSVIKRVLEMDALTDRVAMTGGVVAHNPFLVTMVQEITTREILVPENPQLTGAVGAALFAMENG
ncbi:MAG: acyl-CoA dehydratase activase [Deltaproteobacteria bacterium]|jgi:predicted CoA-substrate-specific enzyme activase